MCIRDRTYAAERGMNSFEAAISHAKKPKELFGEDPEITKGDADAAFPVSYTHLRFSRAFKVAPLPQSQFRGKGKEIMCNPTNGGRSDRGH